MPHDDAPGPAKGDWTYLRQELGRRTVEAFRHAPLVFYVVVAVVLFGGLGIWVEVMKLVVLPPPAPPAPPGAGNASSPGLDLAGLITAVITYFPALIGSAAIQLVLASVGRNDKILISFSLFILCVFSIFAILLPFFSAAHDVAVLLLGVAFSVCAVWVWVIANGDDETFKGIPPAVDAAAGGDPGRSLPGNLDGIQV